jgi:hypothetical protein
MKSKLMFCARLIGAVVVTATLALAAPPESKVTFNKDVLPILQDHCQTCHRPGEVAPMSLLTYQDARPWAKAMKLYVATKKMPPWDMDPQYDANFKNNPKLSQDQIDTLVAWVDSGAPEGDAKDKPAAKTFFEGWNLKPDLVVKMPKDFNLPATGVFDMQYVKVKGSFPEDVWVEAAEMRPGNAKVVHHGEVWVVPPGTKWMANAEYGVAYPQAEMPKDRNSEDVDVIGKYNPGVGAQSFKFGDSAKFIPKGSDLVFELHYTTDGEVTTDRTEVAMQFAPPGAPHKTRYAFSYGPQASNLVIPAGDPNAEAVSELTVLKPVQLVDMQPHMHLRGKDYEVRVIYPTGEAETLGKAKFDFNWQLTYEFAKPIDLPVGTRILGIAHFDNSPNNPFNPDPTKEIWWGAQNWDEMSSGFLGVVFDSRLNPRDLFKRSGPTLLKRVPGQAGPTLATALSLSPSSSAKDQSPPAEQ